MAIRTLGLPPITPAVSGYVAGNDGTKPVWQLATGVGPILETNGTPNGSQALLNLIAGTNVTLTDNGVGGVTIDSTANGFPVADDVAAEWGTTFPSSFTAQVAGQSTPNFTLALDDTHPLMLINSSNLSYDFLGVDATGFFPAPVTIWTGSAQVHNNLFVMGFELGGGSATTFTLTGVGGNDLDGTPRNSDGISLEIGASDGGSLGGSPGNLTFRAGTAQFGNIDGGSIFLFNGQQSGTGDVGVVVIQGTGSGDPANSLVFEGAQEPGLSNFGYSREYTTVSGIKMISENGGAYVPMVGGGGGDLVSATLATASNAIADTTANSGGVTFNIPVTGVDATAHKWIYNIDSINMLYIAADGNGAGGIENGVMTFGNTSIPVIHAFQSGDAAIADNAASFTYAGGDGGDADAGNSAGHGSDVVWNHGDGGAAGVATRLAGAGGANRVFTGDGGAGSASEPSGSGGEILLRTGGPGTDGGAGVGGFGPINLMQDANVRYSIDIFGSHYVTIPTALSPAYKLQDTSGNNYLAVISIVSSEEMFFGNTTTDPDFVFLGTGTFTGPNGPASFPDALTVAQTFTANGPVDINDFTTIDGVSGSTAVSDVVLLAATLTLNPVSDSSTTFFGERSIVQTAAGLNVNLLTVAGLCGGAIIDLDASKALNTAIGVCSHVEVTGGTVTNAFLFYATPLVISGSGAVTNAYGMYIPDLSDPGVGTSYGLVTEHGTSTPLWIKNGYGLFGDVGVAAGLLQLQGATSGSVHITVPNAPSGYTITLPDNVGATGKALTLIDNAGTTDWVTPASGGDITGPGIGNSSVRSIPTWVTVNGDELQNNPGVTISSAGNIALGLTSLYTQNIQPTAATSGFTNYDKFAIQIGNPTGNSTSTTRSFWVDTDIGSAWTHNAGVVENIKSQINVLIPTTHSMIGTNAFVALTALSGAGSLSTAYNYESSFILNSAGVVSNATHYHANDAADAGGGSYTNQYGLYLEDFTSATNNYGIYIAGASTYAIFSDSGVNRFDGNIEFNAFVALSNAATLAINDNQTAAFAIQQSSNNYLVFKTVNGTEAITFGNATTNPLYTFLGSGLTSMAGSLVIGATAIDASAAFEVDSTTKGVRFPNMTTAQRNAIASPANGLVVFDTDIPGLFVYDGTQWVQL